MRIPTHHLREDLLLGHGSCHEQPAVALLVETHALQCPECRTAMDDLDEIAGALLGKEGELPVSGDLRARTLAAATEGQGPIPGASSTSSGQTRPPRPTAAQVLEYVRAGDRAPWRWVAPGVHEIRLGLDWNGVPAKLVRLRRGIRVPLHTHAGRELTLVLAGQLGDRIGLYGPGDIADYDADVAHRQYVPLGCDCTCLVVNERRLVPLSTAAKLLAHITGS